MYMTHNLCLSKDKIKICIPLYPIFSAQRGARCSLDFKGSLHYEGFAVIFNIILFNYV